MGCIKTFPNPCDTIKTMMVVSAEKSLSQCNTFTIDFTTEFPFPIYNIPIPVHKILTCISLTFCLQILLHATDGIPQQTRHADADRRVDYSGKI